MNVPWSRDWPATREITGGRTYYLLEQADFDRACACVNAMDGIDDPAAFVAEAQKQWPAGDAMAVQNSMGEGMNNGALKP